MFPPNVEFFPESAELAEFAPDDYSGAVCDAMLESLDADFPSTSTED